MLKRLKGLILKASVAGLLVAPLVPVTVAAQNIEDELCKGASFDVSETGTADCTDGGTAETRVDQILDTVITIFSLVVGVISVIMIIIGGLKYITSGGDSGNVTGAKNTILYAVIGLVVVALAQIIVKFVLTKARAE